VVWQEEKKAEYTSLLKEEEAKHAADKLDTEAKYASSAELAKKLSIQVAPGTRVRVSSIYTHFNECVECTRVCRVCRETRVRVRGTQAHLRHVCGVCGVCVHACVENVERHASECEGRRRTCGIQAHDAAWTPSFQAASRAFTPGRVARLYSWMPLFLPCIASCHGLRVAQARRAATRRISSMSRSHKAYVEYVAQPQGVSRVCRVARDAYMARMSRARDAAPSPWLGFTQLLYSMLPLIQSAYGILPPTALECAARERHTLTALVRHAPVFDTSCARPRAARRSDQIIACLG
jgi:Pyruvate/2-oxoacid:ferredoxin oxidoreductase delta subunit